MKEETKDYNLKQFFLIWTGQAFSLLGSRLVQFALIWWLTRTTGSATVLALASLVGLLPQVILGPFVGVLVDRWPRRAVMLASDSMVALVTLALGYLFWQGAAGVGAIFAALFLRALAGSFHWPAMQASTSLMVPSDQLTRIQGLNQSLYGGLNIVAAPLGALLLEIVDITGIIAVDVGTALLAIIPLLFFAVPQPPSQAEAGTGLAGFWQDLGDGLRYVRSWPAMLILIGLAVLINLVLTPAFALLPLLVTRHFHGVALHLAWLEAASGVGIVAGGVLLGTWGGFRRRIYTSLAGVLGIGLSALLIGLVPAGLFPLAVGALFGMGLMLSLTDGPVHAILQVTVVPEMQGRVFMLLNSFATLMAPLGLILAGPLADLFGVRFWFVIAGLVTLAAGVAGLFSPTLLQIEERHSRGAPVQVAAG